MQWNFQSRESGFGAVEVIQRMQRYGNEGRASRFVDVQAVVPQSSIFETANRHDDPIRTALEHSGGCPL